jgi:hypothetical protein
MASLKVAARLLPMATAVAASTGMVVVTVGAKESLVPSPPSQCPVEPSPPHPEIKNPVNIKTNKT